VFGDERTKRIIFLSLFLCLFLPSLSAAWEESLEGHWDELSAPDGYSIAYGTTSTSEGFHMLGGTLAAFEIYKNFDDSGYLRFNYKAVYNTDAHIVIYDSLGNQVYDILTPVISPYSTWHTYEIVENLDHSSVTVYQDGNIGSTFARKTQSVSSKIYLSAYSSSPVYIDDVSTSPFMIGTPGFFSPNSGTLYTTVTVPLTNTYHLTLSKQSGEVINSWNITSKIQTISYAVNTYFSDDGFYYYDLVDANGKLYYSKLLYYNSLGVYPTTYFSISSDTAADIRDKDLNGGTITGGGTVYLYPSAAANNYQNFTVEFQQPAYNRELTVTKIFNTSQLDGSQISLTGLSPNVYNVSIDSVYVGSTGGSNSWSHVVNWIGDNSYIIELSPDFSSPGAWGYVIDSSTKEKIPYAQIYLSNSSFSTTAYADENGMYYIGGLQPGAYSIQASKKSYSSSVAQPFTAIQGAITRQDLYLESSGNTSGSGLYYAPHSVTFTILEYWYNYTGLPGTPYSVYDNENGIEIKSGNTDSKGQFTVKEMDGGINYTITLSYKGKNITEYVEPGLSEYTYVLNPEGSLHTYMNSWLTLSYAQNTTNATVTYSSNKTLSGASLIATASNGTIVYNQVLSSQNGTFFFPFSPGDYSLQFHVKASDNSEASQAWTISSPVTINLFPGSYPTWLKNLLFVAILLFFLLAFGKAHNDVACGSVAILTSFGYLFKWLTCSFELVVLIWIIAICAIVLHYKRTGALG
jgi:hypothetical protein